MNGWKDERMNGREWTYHVLYKCEGECEWILWEYSHFWMIVQIWVGTFVLTQWEYLYPCGFLWHFVGISTLVWVDELLVCVAVWICMCELWQLNSCSFVVLYHEKCVPLSLHYPWHDNRMFIHAVCPSVVGRLVGHTFKRDKNKTSLQIPIVSHLPVIFSDDNKWSFCICYSVYVWIRVGCVCVNIVWDLDKRISIDGTLGHTLWNWFSPLNA